MATSSSSEFVYSFIGPSCGLRSRLRQARVDMRTDRTQWRWYPWDRLLDPMANLDMCTPLERAWVSRYIETAYTGEGSIVELGTWLGGITLSIARSITHSAAAEAAESSVHVFEQFTHNGQAARVAGSPLEASYEEGGSFRSHFDRRLRRYRDRVNVHSGDVSEATWDQRAPIELLFNDVSKTWPIWHAVRNTFYPALIPGVSTVVEQDFTHAWTPWLHLWHFRARDSFKVIERVPHSGSIVFELVHELAPELFRPESFFDYSEAEIDDAYAWAQSIVNPDMTSNVSAAKVVLTMLYGDPLDSTRRLVDALVASDPDHVAFSELITDVAPEIARRLEEAQIEEAMVPNEPCEVIEQQPLPTLAAISAELTTWAGRPPLVISAEGGIITAVNPIPNWLQGLLPHQWVGGRLEELDVIVTPLLPTERWTGVIERDDGASEVVVLLGRNSASRQLRVVTLQDEANCTTQLVLASPDLDLPAKPLD